MNRDNLVLTPFFPLWGTGQELNGSYFLLSSSFPLLFSPLGIRRVDQEQEQQRPVLSFSFSLCPLWGESGIRRRRRPGFFPLSSPPPFFSCPKRRGLPCSYPVSLAFPPFGGQRGLLRWGVPPAPSQSEGAGAREINEQDKGGKGGYFFLQTGPVAAALPAGSYRTGG